MPGPASVACPGMPKQLSIMSRFDFDPYTRISRLKPVRVVALLVGVFMAAFIAFEYLLTGKIDIIETTLSHLHLTA
jgi:hypothetical protein